jgi:hypothetical protein
VEDVWLVMNQNAAAGNTGIAASDSGSPVFWRTPDGELIVVGIASQTDERRAAAFWVARTDLPESLEFIRFIIALVDGGWF